MITPASAPPGFAPTSSFGFLSNEGKERYLLEAQSTTGFVAWKLADGTILISNAMQVSLPPSAFVVFWSCAGYQDTTPAGQITAFDCHGNALTFLLVKELKALRFLDCSYNRISVLTLSGLVELEALNANNNLLRTLSLADAASVRFLSCSNNPMIEDVL